MTDPERKRQGRWALPALLAAVAVVALVVLGAQGGEAPEPARMAAQPVDVPPFPEPGSVAPDFALPVLVSGDGAEPGGVLRLSEQRGRYVLVNFWAPWCIPCIAEHGDLLALQEAYPRDELRVIGVVFEEAPARVRGWLPEHGGAGFTHVTDPGRRAAMAYRVRGIPEPFLIDPEGRLVGACDGCSHKPHELEDVRARLEQLLGR